MQGATWALSAAYAGWSPAIAAPLTLKVTAAQTGQTLELPSVITQIQGGAQFWTAVQFNDTGRR